MDVNLTLFEDSAEYRARIKDIEEAIIRVEKKRLARRLEKEAHDEYRFEALF